MTDTSKSLGYYSFNTADLREIMTIIKHIRAPMLLSLSSYHKLGRGKESVKEKFSYQKQTFQMLKKKEKENSSKKAMNTYIDCKKKQFQLSYQYINSLYNRIGIRRKLPYGEEVTYQQKHKKCGNW